VVVMVKVDVGCLVRIHYKRNDGEEFTGSFLGYTPEEITKDLLRHFKMKGHQVKERMFLSDVHGITRSMLFNLFVKYEQEFLKHKENIQNKKEAIDNIVDIPKYLERGDKSAPYF
jgi:hypothetical protein